MNPSRRSLSWLVFLTVAILVSLALLAPAGVSGSSELTNNPTQLTSSSPAAMQTSTINITINDSSNGEDSNTVPITIESQQSAPVQENTVALSGSTVTINTGGAASVGVDQLPIDSVTVSDISDGGAVSSSNPDGIAWSSAAGLPDTVSFTLTPNSSYAAGDTISFTADGTDVSLTVEVESDSAREIALSGSTVELSTGGVGAFGVDDLPSDVTVSEISDSGGQPPSNPDGIIWNSAAGLPETVSFTLTPDSSYTAGDTISFTADGTEITYTVVEISKPEELSDDVSSDQYAAFAGDDDEITQQDAVNGFNGWFNNGKYRGEELSQREALELFNYWFDKGS